MQSARPARIQDAAWKMAVEPVEQFCAFGKLAEGQRGKCKRQMLNAYVVHIGNRDAAHSEVVQGTLATAAISVRLNSIFSLVNMIE